MDLRDDNHMRATKNTRVSIDGYHLNFACCPINALNSKKHDSWQCIQTLVKKYETVKMKMLQSLINFVRITF